MSTSDHTPSKPLHNLIADAATPDAGRRGFVRGAVALTALGGSGALLSGCGGADGLQASFPQGVASGDPLSDRVILWTRVLVQDGVDTADVTVNWEVASDANFTTIAARGSAVAKASGDFTVKVDATGLKAGTRYWYRFAVGATYSPVGRTKTLPTGSVAQVKLAVFSCSNYPAGYFHAYAEAAKREDLDAVLHLGDYIYEYGRSGYASTKAASMGREVEPAGEIVALADYRRRYAQYRGDANLQALHAAAPMIAVWDDHEFANDAYMGGADNHQSATEGDWAVRKAAALQAYHEWMPIRSGANRELIYRSFDFGNLVSLHMLDTRIVGRDKQLDYANYMTANGFNSSAFAADMASTSRQMMGSAQTAWLQQRLAASNATWQLLGQQVLMARMNIPAPILFEANNPGSGVSVSTYAAIVAKAQTAPATLTATEKAILAQPSIPYNLDAWDGYAMARETVLATARQLDKNLVVLAGDTHNAWASELQDYAGNPVGVEFGTSSVSSPGFEEYLPKENPAVLAGALTQLIKTLKYCDTSRRGYLLITATSAECRADFVFTSSVFERTYTATTGASWKVLPGAAGQRKLLSA